MHLADRSDRAGLNDFHRAAEAIFSAALISHLGGDFIFGRHLAHHPRFVNRMGQRLLAIDMFAQLHGHDAGRRVVMIGRGDDDGIDLLYLFEHLAVIAIKTGARIFLAALAQPGVIHIAKRHDVFAGAGVGVAGAFAVGADDGDVEFFARRFEADLGCGRITGQHGGAGGDGGVFDEVAPREN